MMNTDEPLKFQRQKAYKEKMPNLRKTSIWLLMGLFFWMAVPGPCQAAPSIREQYFQADACERKLRDSAKKRKYRENWLRCIEQFQAVQRKDPDGQWAAAGLFHAAGLYADLGRFSGRRSDIEESEDLYQRIVRRFPKSAYSRKANEALARLAGKKAKGRTAGPKSSVSARTKRRAGEAGRLLGQAENAYQRLMKKPRWQVYRDKWLAVVEKYQKAYRHDPRGPVAPAALFMTGKVYSELYRKSYLGSDKREALDLLARVAKRFPNSGYRKKADAAIKRLGPAGKSVPPKPKAPEKPAAPRPPGPSEKAFSEATDDYRRIQKNPRWQKNRRDKWMAAIEKFDAVHRDDPHGPMAPAALYMAGKLYEEMAGHSHLKSDRAKSKEMWTQLIRRFPDSDYSRRAARAAGLKLPEAEASVSPDPGSPESDGTEPAPDPVAAAIAGAAGAVDKAEGAAGANDDNGMHKAQDAEAGAGTAAVTGLRYWSNPRYTRVVIDADRKADYGHRLLQQDPAHQKPQRLYVDLANSRLASGLQKTVPINDNLLKDARAGQFSAGSVRVVIDIKSFKTYKIFSLRNPFRIVIDVWGKGTDAPEGPVEPRITVEAPTAKSLAAQLGLGVRRIAIDPGHGGRDYGAPGFLKGVHEKKVVMQIGKRLAKKIRAELGCEAFLTRSGDTYLSLEERTAIANTKNADLFISIHTNAVRDRRAYGIETYFLNLATDEDAIRVAAKENATSTKNISDLQSILTDLMKNAKINESSRLAGHVQTRMTRGLKKTYSRIRNKGVKQAPFYVLLGAQMPAILIETSFISNSRECKRLVSTQYQEKLCDGIVDGIRAYIREINPSSLSRGRTRSEKSG
jgi:N-acetylmuramoyl-L-alanine amidase